jgi:hypothetical protein
MVKKKNHLACTRTAKVVWQIMLLTENLRKGLAATLFYAMCEHIHKIVYTAPHNVILRMLSDL